MAESEVNEQNDLDHAHLQKPVEVGVAGVEQIVRCFSSGTDEIQQLLRYECDILFECRICKSLFRALPNLLIHKRNYCTQTVKDFNVITSKLSYANYDLGYASERFSSFKETETFKPEDESENGDVDSELEPESDYVAAVKGTKMAPVVKKHESAQKNTALIKLNRIDNVKERGPAELGKNVNSVSKMTKEVSKRKQDTEILDSPIKKLKKSENQESSGQTSINMDLRKQPAKTLKGKELANSSESASDDSSSLLWKKYLNTKQLKCMLCKICFSTRKSLRTHMRNFHSGKRTLFRCLYCENEYTKPQSLKRHLINGHKKTPKQVKRLGNMIQKNKFVKEMPNGIGAPVFSPTKTGYRKIDHTMPKLTAKFSKKLSTSKVTEDKSDKIKKESPAGVLGKHSLKIKKIVKSEDPEKIVRPTKKLASKLTLTKCMNCGKMFGNMESFEKHRPGCANKQSGNGNDSGAEPSNSNKKSGKSAGESKKDGKTTNRIEGKKGKCKGAKDEIENNEDYPDLNGIENAEYSEKDSSWESIFVESDDEDEDQKFDKIKKAGVRIDEENLTCLMCCMQYKSVSSLMRHCIRHLGWRRFKCKYCKFTAYHKSECKSHLNRVHKMIPKNAHELNKCIIEMNVDEEPKSHKINMNISTNQPVRTVKAFTKQTRAAIYKKKVLFHRKSTSSDSSEESSPVSSQGSGDSNQNGIRITRSGRISQAPTKKYALETELGDFKTTRKQKLRTGEKQKNGRVLPSTRSNASGSKSAADPSAQEILKKLPPNVKISPEQNVQMQCVKIKSSDFEAHNSALKDLIQKQENLQVVNHQGKKFYVVVMPKGQALPNSVTPSKSDVAPEVINQALSLVKSPGKKSRNEEFSSKNGEQRSIKNPSVKLEKLRCSRASTGDKEVTNDDTPVLEPVQTCEEIETGQMKDTPPKLGAPYEVCETDD